MFFINLHQIRTVKHTVAVLILRGLPAIIIRHRLHQPALKDRAQMHLRHDLL